MHEPILDFIWIAFAIRFGAPLRVHLHWRQRVGSKFLKKCLSLLLTGLVLCPCTPLFASGLSKQERRAAQVKAAILKLGVGKDARVRVTLSNKQEVNDYVTQSSDHYFLVGRFNTDETTLIPYGDVKSLRGVDVATDTRVSAGIGIGRTIKGAIRLTADTLATPRCRAPRGNSLSGEHIVLIAILASVLVLGILFTSKT
jgi:hypothetical protein